MDGVPGERHDAKAARGPGWIVTGALALAVLHFGRPVLEPIAIAGILTLTLAPLVRRVRAMGLTQTAATFVTVAFVAACVVGLAAVIASQLAEVARELPRYRDAIGAKAEQMSAFIARPIERWEADMATVWPDSSERRSASGRTSDAAPAMEPIPVEIRHARPGASATLSRMFTTVGGPIGEAAVVLVLLLFMLLGRESIRERLIRLAGEKEIARTMQALADTDEGVSRYFASLVVVNASFAAVSSIALTLLGLPHAILWGSVVGLMRFVPYLGVPTAVAVVVLFASAVDPGWSLALSSLALLVALDLLLTNVVEPNVYGHTMGLAPFAIIVSALFWGTLWGPVALIVSAPLTLCLVVAGRHVSALAPLTVLFGNSPGTTLALRFYQRALAGEAEDVLDEARKYVKGQGLARYCDDVLLPAFALGSADVKAGQIDRRQDEKLRRMLVELVESLRGHGKRRRRTSIAEATMGAQLRRLREANHGQAQGSLDVPRRSIVLCAGLANERDELLTELLVRTLRDAGLDARSVSLESLPPNDRRNDPELVSGVLLTAPEEENFDRWREGCALLRSHLSHAVFGVVRSAGTVGVAIPADAQMRRDGEIVLHSFSEAMAFASQRRDEVEVGAERRAEPDSSPRSRNPATAAEGGS